MTINNPGSSIELPACYLDRNREAKKNRCQSLV